MPLLTSMATLAGLGLVPMGDFVPLASVTVGSGGASSIEFTSIPTDGTYQHLQVRGITRATVASTEDNLYFQLNSDTGSNYRSHSLYGDGSSALANTILTTSGAVATIPGASATANTFGAFTLDILDYASTSKNTVTRAFSGNDKNGSGYVHLRSALWLSTSAVSSIKFIVYGGSNFAQYSTAALYGIKA